MERGLIFDQEPARVLDLGTGCSNVHLNIEPVNVQETDFDGNAVEVVKYKADILRVANPATEDRIIVQAKEQMIAEIKVFDKSDKVNAFSVGGEKLWIDKETRVGLKLRFDAEKLAGKTEAALWGNNRSYPLQIDQAIQMLLQLEVYASECYDVTAQHIVAVSALTSAEEVVNYNFRVGYPTKLEF